MVDKVENISKDIAYFDPMESWEEGLVQIQKLVHENHYLAMDVKRTLIQLYGTRKGTKLFAQYIYSIYTLNWPDIFLSTIQTDVYLCTYVQKRN